MDDKLFEKGLAKRKATLGAEYVEKTLPRLTNSHVRSRKR